MKPCKFCGKDIELRKTDEGWRPFNPDSSRHYCRTPAPANESPTPTPTHQPSITKHKSPRQESQYERPKKFGSFSGEHQFIFHVYRMYRVTVQATNAKEAKKQLDEQQLPEPDFQHVYNAEVVAEDIKTDSIQPVFI